MVYKKPAKNNCKSNIIFPNLSGIFNTDSFICAILLLLLIVPASLLPTHESSCSSVPFYRDRWSTRYYQECDVGTANSTASEIRKRQIYRSFTLCVNSTASEIRKYSNMIMMLMWRGINMVRWVPINGMESRMVAQWWATTTYYYYTTSDELPPPPVDPHT